MKFVTTLVLVACSVSIGCQRAATESDTEPLVASDPGSQPEPPLKSDETPEFEPARPFEIIYLVDRQLWQIDPDGTHARSLGYEVPSDGFDTGSRVGGGTHEPTISRDGRWLACLTGPNLLVVELNGQRPQVHPITKLPPAKDNFLVAANVSFSEWSPDSSTLLVALEVPGYEEDEPLPLPSGYSYGFHVLRGTDLQLVHAPHIDSYLGWLPDSRAVIDNKYIGQRDYELVAYPIAPGPAKVLQRSHDPYGYNQLNVMGEWMAWTASGADGKASQVMVASIAGGEARPLSPRGTFAEIQGPRLSPSGKRAVFARNGKRVLGEGEGTPVEWPSHSDFYWWDDEHLITMTDAGLVMMDLQGQARVLDAAATELVHH